MYKIVNPFKYLTKKEKVLFSIEAVVNTVSFITLVLGNTFLLRGISAIMYMVTNLLGMMFILKIQAHITKDEFYRPPCNCDCHSNYDDNDDYEDSDDYDSDNDDEDEDETE